MTGHARIRAWDWRRRRWNRCGSGRRRRWGNRCVGGWRNRSAGRRRLSGRCGRRRRRRGSTGRQDQYRDPDQTHHPREGFGSHVSPLFEYSTAPGLPKSARLRKSGPFVTSLNLWNCAAFWRAALSMHQDARRPAGVYRIVSGWHAWRTGRSLQTGQQCQPRAQPRSGWFLRPWSAGPRVWLRFPLLHSREPW